MTPAQVHELDAATYAAFVDFQNAQTRAHNRAAARARRGR